MTDTASAPLPSWLLSTARQRLRGFLDEGSFVEFLPPTDRVVSPHLAAFDLPAAFDDGVVIGRGRFEGEDVLVAAQEGQFVGGTFAEISGAKILGLIRAARDGAARTVILLIDSGGVRLQEANAGEIAVAEIMRAIAEARTNGVRIAALVGGRAGAFGGAGLTSATCSTIVISDQGRTGVTGPEVIETNKGVEEFDSSDRGMVWSVVGGRNRYLIGGADGYAEDDYESFRTVTADLLAKVHPFSLETLREENSRLSERLGRFADSESPEAMWKKLHIKDAGHLSDMPDPAFVTMADKLRKAGHDAR